MREWEGAVTKPVPFIALALLLSGCFAAPQPSAGVMPGCRTSEGHASERQPDVQTHAVAVKAIDAITGRPVGSAHIAINVDPHDQYALTPSHPCVLAWGVTRFDGTLALYAREGPAHVVHPVEEGDQSWTQEVANITIGEDSTPVVLALWPRQASATGAGTLGGFVIVDGQHVQTDVPMFNGSRAETARFERAGGFLQNMTLTWTNTATDNGVLTFEVRAGDTVVARAATDATLDAGPQRTSLAFAQLSAEQFRQGLDQGFAFRVLDGGRVTAPHGIPFHLAYSMPLRGPFEPHA